MMKNLKGSPFFELKRRPEQVRVLYYHPDSREDTAVLTNGFKKKTDKTPPNELKRAERIKEEYEELVKNGQA
jgi:phage-related protein